MPVSQQILAAQQHLQPALGHQLAQRAQAFPWVLIQEADAGIKGCAAPALHRPITGIVYVFAGRNHVIQSHAGGKQALMRVSKRQFCNLNNAGHLRFSPIYLIYSNASPSVVRDCRCVRALAHTAILDGFMPANVAVRWHETIRGLGAHLLMALAYWVLRKLIFSPSSWYSAEQMSPPQIIGSPPKSWRRVISPIVAQRGQDMTATNEFCP